MLNPEGLLKVKVFAQGQDLGLAAHSNEAVSGFEYCLRPGVNGVLAAVEPVSDYVNAGVDPQVKPPDALALHVLW